MTDANNSFEKIRYMSTAHWLLGYADSLDKDRYPALIHRLQTAADLLLEVWEAALLEEKQ